MFIEIAGIIAIGIVALGSGLFFISFGASIILKAISEYKELKEKKLESKLRSYIGEQKYAIEVLKMAINDDEKVKKLFSDHRIEL